MVHTRHVAERVIAAADVLGKLDRPEQPSRAPAHRGASRTAAGCRAASGCGCRPSAGSPTLTPSRTFGSAHHAALLTSAVGRASIVAPDRPASTPPASDQGAHAALPRGHEVEGADRRAASPRTPRRCGRRSRPGGRGR
jgi:hypothetical protein